MGARKRLKDGGLLEKCETWSLQHSRKALMQIEAFRFVTVGPPKTNQQTSIETLFHIMTDHETSPIIAPPLICGFLPIRLTIP